MLESEQEKSDYVRGRIIDALSHNLSSGCIEFVGEEIVYWTVYVKREMIQPVE